MNHKKIFLVTLIFLVALVIVTGTLLLLSVKDERKIEKPCSSCTPTLLEKKAATPTIEKEGESPIKSVLNDVPFTSQAPFGEWSDPKQQDACEEATSLMAVRFAKNQTQALTKAEARLEILAIAKFQQDKYGDSRDTSANDTMERIINGYYGLSRVSLREVNSTNDIIRELMKGNIVITPMNGQLLNNPHFTQPGPERHMVVIVGYSLETDEFITNDPGVWQGEGYRYPASVLFNAIRDYSTGYHVPIDQINKVMIVISKEN